MPHTLIMFVVFKAFPEGSFDIYWYTKRFDIVILAPQSAVVVVVVWDGSIPSGYRFECSKLFYVKLTLSVGLV